MTSLTGSRGRGQSPVVRGGDMQDLFDRFFGMTEEAASTAFVPAMDVSETNDSILVRAEVPGLDPKEIDVSIKDDILTLRGEKKVETETKDETTHRIERSFGSFSRSFRLPATVVTDKVAADYKNGVLLVTLPKADESKRREVRIAVS